MDDSSAHQSQLEEGRKRADHWFRVVTMMVLGVVLAAVFVAAILLPRAEANGSPWTPVLQDVLTTGYQALAIGLLGGLAKLLLDRRRERDVEAAERAAEEAARAAQLRDRRYEYIRDLVRASHDIDAARMRTQANRSVRTWTDVVEETLVPARSQLRLLKHELENWRGASQPVFAKSEAIEKCLSEMADYLGHILWEHSNNKMMLAEDQRDAELLYGSERREAVKALAESLLNLPKLNAFLGNDYGDQFRSKYVRTLSMMRSNLTG